MDHGASERGPVLFGQTAVHAIVGELSRQSVQAVVVSTNARGTMTSGSAGGVRMAGGSEIERDAMAAAPLVIGTCVSTPSGALADRGIERVLHAVVVDQAGGRARESNAVLALGEALVIAESERLRSVALPLLGLDPVAHLDERRQHAGALVRALISHLRRSSRLQEVRFVTRMEDDAAMTLSVVREARERMWPNR